MSNRASIRALKPPRRGVSAVGHGKMAETGGNNSAAAPRRCGQSVAAGWRIGKDQEELYYLCYKS